eukprot:scaffold21489_cov61-Skeletonema_dohrnii-CCMP3373.AAC.1
MSLEGHTGVLIPKHVLLQSRSLDDRTPTSSTDDARDNSTFSKSNAYIFHHINTMIPSSDRSGNSLFAAASLFVVLSLLCQSIFFEATAFQPSALNRINHFKNDAPRFRFPTALPAAKKKKQSNDDNDSDDEAIISIPSTTAARK